MAHLDVIGAVRAHPSGVPLFICVALACAYSFVAAYRGTPFRRAFDLVRPDLCAVLLSASLFIVWAVRLVTAIYA